MESESYFMLTGWTSRHFRNLLFGWWTK